VDGQIRSTFEQAARGFSELVAEVEPDQWSWPALGDWDVRSLVGHTSRALATIAAYVDRPAAGPALDGPVAYYLAALGTDPERASRREIDRAIAERGRQAGAELGADPASAVDALVDRTLAVVEASSDDRPVHTPVGPMTLAAYLPTRTFELTVHGLDLARAVDREPPAVLAEPIQVCCLIAAEVAARRPGAAELLLELTGRPRRRPVSSLF
jgi:uncharacterized protein (TIGR03083 family)